MIPLWQHVVTVLALALALTCANALTFWVGMRSVRRLRAALTAKRVLLGQFQSSFEQTEYLVGGDKMVLVDNNENILEITTTNATQLTVRVFDR